MKAAHFASPVLALCGSLLFPSQTFAQSPGAPAPAAPALSAAPAVPALSAAPAAPALDQQGRPNARQVRDDCKAGAEAQGLQGEGKRNAVMECVVKQRPDLAAKLAAREQCRVDGKAKGLKKDDLKSFVKDCAKGKG